MTAVTPTYTIDNLPAGFTFDRDTRQIFSPAIHKYSRLNDDNSVHCPPMTYESVNSFVETHLFLIENKHKMRDVTSEHFRDRYVTIKCLDCIIDREKLVLLSIFIGTLLIVCMTLPITCYTWPHGVFG